MNRYDFLRIGMIAVLDGIDKRLFQRKVYSKYHIFAESMLLQSGKQCLDNPFCFGFRAVNLPRLMQNF